MISKNSYNQVFINFIIKKKYFKSKTTYKFVRITIYKYGTEVKKNIFTYFIHCL